MTEDLALRDGFSPELLDRFRDYLAKTGDLAEIKRLHDGAQAYRRFTDKRSEQRLAAIGAIWAAYRGGEILASDPNLRPGPNSDRLSLSFPNLPDTAARKLSSRWQQLYAKGEEGISEYVGKADWPTLSGALAAHGGQPAPMPPFPEGTFGVIYADPPWRYEGSLSQSRQVEANYQTLETPDIVAMPIHALLAESAILFLWAVSPKIPEALMVMDGWGFDYTTCAVWVKDRIGPGYTFRQQHELLLVGKQGNMPTPPQASRPSSVIEAPRREHSAKPEVVYELIEHMYPAVPKLELFARTERAGWTSWGNEVP